MNVMIVGTGYVGLTTAVSLAILGKKRGVQVKSYCMDTIQHKINLINDGKTPFYEEGLEDLLKEAKEDGLLVASTNMSEFISLVDLIFICVGTPSRDDGSMDLKFIKSAATDIGQALKQTDTHPIICVKSTVLPGTSRNIILPLIEKSSGKTRGRDFDLVVTPEFLREGSAVHDNFHPDRIIIGEINEVAGKSVENFYKKLLPEPPILRMSPESAEFVKYASNSFLAMKISFANEMSRLAEAIPGVDVVEVMEGIGLDKRISPHFLNAGVGFGGSCFPKDVSALAAFSREKELEPFLLEATLEINDSQPVHFVSMFEKSIPQAARDLTVSILGLAFKPGTSDMRHARSIKVIQELKKLPSVKIIKVHDPVAMDEARKELEKLKINVNFSPTALECIKDSDACFIVTEWDEYKKITPEMYVELMRDPFILDGRRIYDKTKYSKMLRYKAIGLGEITDKP
ncbi:MAG: UDP-glucose dehydrogenase family protein [Candidatus Helarchaeales archaeon]